MLANGTVVAAYDLGTVWQLLYKTADGIERVTMDHRSFMHFYEGVTGASFYRDYRFGAGQHYVAKRLCGINISVSGEPYRERITVEDDGDG